METTDIQGLVARGYGKFPAAQFLLLTIRPEYEEQARAYLRTLAVAPIEPSPWDHEPKQRSALHVAFTYQGLAKLGVRPEILATFSREFIEGMHDQVRAQQLGDDPDSWRWGKPDALPDVLLMIYASRDLRLDEELARQRAAMGEAFLVEVKPTQTLPNQREHFGFRDGISTPVIAGLGGRNQPEPTWTKPFAAGEFVLGYPNDYGAFTESPTDLGTNGTYLVFREMRQFVPELWDYLRRESREAGADEPERAIALGAKMVGRWPGGAPRTLTAKDDPAHANTNSFTYANLGPVHADELGMQCPLGSHVRRANPRDQFHSGRDRSDSQEMIRKHQMLRRGRTFGPPLVESMEPRDMLAVERPRDQDGLERGLYFVCLVGHIGRQFELVQRAWIQSPVFATLSKDGDPIIGTRRTGVNTSDEFTCPAEPVRRKYRTLPEFTRVTGGAYFFMPGLRALQAIARGPG